MKKTRFIALLCVLTILVFSFSGCSVITSLKPTPEITPTPTVKPTPTPSPTPEPIPLTGEEWLKMARNNLPKYIPLDIIMSFNEYSTPQISADGSKIAYRHFTDDDDVVKILNRETGETKDVPWPDGTNGIPHFTLMPDGNKVLFFIDHQGDENFGLYLSDVKKGTSIELIPAGILHCGFSGFHPKDKNKFYVYVVNPQTSAFDIISIDTKRMKSEYILANPGNIISWEFDSKGRLAIVETINEDASQDVWLRNNPKNNNPQFMTNEWTKILTWSYEDTDNSEILTYDDERQTLLITDSTVANSTSVYEYNIETGGRILISTDDQGIHDPTGLWINYETGKVDGVAYMRERVEWQCENEAFQSHVDYLTSLHDGDMHIIDSNEDDHFWIVAYESDVKATDYYIYDAVEMEASFLYNANSSLDGYDYAPMEPIVFQSSDELTIHGYTTFPVNLERKDLPLVVMVHGGPWTRDIWGFDPEVQFLANRGYMVLQVNFRGSTGYGKEFMLAGDMEWGQKMHQDILDAIDWVIAQGWVNPDRVAIYGASYGGYEALVGAAFTPERFACAVDCFGPSSLLTLVSSQPPQWSSYANNLYRSIGDPTKDAVVMMDRSPYYKAEYIKIPLLVVQGGNDVRVTQQESDQLVTAMREVGIPVEYIFFPDAGHGFSSEEEIETFYNALEEFLAENIGGINNVH